MTIYVRAFGYGDERFFKHEVETDEELGLAEYLDIFGRCAEVLTSIYGDMCMVQPIPPDSIEDMLAERNLTLEDVNDMPFAINVPTSIVSHFSKEH